MHGGVQIKQMTVKRKRCNPGRSVKKLQERERERENEGARKCTRSRERNKYEGASEKLDGHRSNKMRKQRAKKRRKARKEQLS